MSDLEITITGPTGSGKTALASWLSHQLLRRAQSGLGACVIYEDDATMLDSGTAEQRLNAVMCRAKVTIRTVQVSRRAWAERDEVRDVVPPRDCPACDYSIDEHRLSNELAELAIASRCSYTQEDLTP